MSSWQAELRAQSFLGPHYPGGSGCAAFHQRFIDSAQGDGELLCYKERALVGIWQSGPTIHCIVHRKWQDPGALAWCRSVLADRIPEHDARLQITLPTADRALHATLFELGLGINAVNLAGRVPQAHAALVQAYDPPRQVPGVQLRPLTPADADQVLALRERVFGAEPVYAWFATHPEHQARIRAGILRDDWVGLRQVVEVQGQIRGLVECRRLERCPHHHSAGSTGLMLDAELRGRGLAKTAYRLILEDLLEHDIGWIKGTTGRRSVMHLSRVMGRGPTGVILRRDHTLPADWFTATLHPEAPASI